MTIRRIATIGVVMVAVAGAILGGSAAIRRMRESDRQVPTTRVQRGRLEMKVYTTGDLRPARTAMLVAPSVGGGLQIVRLEKTGRRVQAGDVVLEFDPSEQEYNLAQSRSEVDQAEQEIRKMKADIAVQEAEERTALLKARFDVRRAELETGKNDLLPAITAKKNLLNLEEAKRRLVQLQADLESHQLSRRADLAVQQEKLNRAELSMQTAKVNIENMKVKSPIDGVVSLKENMDASGGIFFSGMVLPEYRAGDQVWPGRMIAEVIEVEQMEVRSKIREIDRGNVSPNLPVEVAIDAYPGSILRGKVKSVAGLASRGSIFDDSTRTFDASFQVTPGKLPLRAGISAQVAVFGNPVKDALIIPRQALFQKDGRPVVYVRSGKLFMRKEVKIARATEDKAEIEGLGEGTEVALIDPEEKTRRAAKASGPIAAQAGGGGR